MIKSIIKIIFLVLISWSGFAQKHSEKQENTISDYSFNSSIIFEITASGNKHKNIEVETQFFFDNTSEYIGVKDISQNFLNPNPKYIFNFAIVDLKKNRILNYFNNKGKKIFTNLAGGGESDLLKEIKKGEPNISISKTKETKTILGKECEGFLVKREGFNTIIWVSIKKEPFVASLNERIANLASKIQLNCFAYNIHPDIVKMVKEDRAVLGYSIEHSTGGTANVQFTKIKESDDFVFEATAYKYVK